MWVSVLLKFLFWYGVAWLLCAPYILAKRIKWKRKVRFLREEIMAKELEMKKKYLNGKFRSVLDRAGDTDIIGVVECKGKRLAYMTVTKKSLIFMEYEGDNKTQFFHFNEMQDIKMKTWGIHWVPVKKLSFVHHGEKLKFYFSLFITHLPDSMAIKYVPRKDLEKVMIIASEPFVEKISGLIAG
jgi:hypothetical protein